MSEATYRQAGKALDYTPVSAMSAGTVVQLADGRAGVNPTGLAASAIGAVQIEGVHRIAKTSDVNILDGGKVYWDHSANTATYRTNGDRDFYIGCAVGDSLSTATTVDVALNVEPVYLLDMRTSPFDQLPVYSDGLASTTMLGGSTVLKFTTTGEAQKADALTKDGFSPDAKAIAEFGVEVVSNGDASALDINFGIANGTDSDDASEITEYVFFHLDGNSTDLEAASTDGTTTVGETDTTVNITVGTRFECWIDARDKTDVKLYVNGARVLSSETFSLDDATGPLKLLAHMEKTSDDTPGEVHIDWARVRISQ